MIPIGFGEDESYPRTPTSREKDKRGQGRMISRLVSICTRPRQSHAEQIEQSRISYLGLSTNNRHRSHTIITAAISPSSKAIEIFGD